MKKAATFEQAPRTHEVAPVLRWGRATAIVAGAALVLSGCTLLSPATDATPTPIPTLGQSLFETYDVQYGDCRPIVMSLFGKDQEMLSEFAEDCEAVYEDADIALVNYVLDPDVAEKYANDIEAELEQASDGIINPTIIVIEPSELARSILEYNTPDNCAEFGNLEDNGSFIAAATMPNLSEYDQILGITDNSVCDSTVVGVADGSYGRYAELFYVKRDLDAIAENGGEPVIEIPFEDGGAAYSFLTNPVLTGTHELLHNFGLGHSGDLQTTYGLFSELYLNNYRLDLSSYFNSGVYTEYGQVDQMGNPSNLPDGTTLNPIHISTLEWPEHVLEQDTKIEVHDVWESPAVFTSENTGSYVANVQLTMSLPTPREASGSTSEYASSQYFDQLSFIGENFDGKLQSIHVYAVGSGESIVDLGQLFMPSDGITVNHLELFVEGTDIYIDFAEGQATVSVIATGMAPGL